MIKAGEQVTDELINAQVLRCFGDLAGTTNLQTDAYADLIEAYLDEEISVNEAIWMAMELHRPPRRAIVQVVGGVAEVIEADPGVEVEIRDLDNEG